MIRLLTAIFLQASSPVAGGRVVHLDDAVHTAIKQQPSILEARAATEAASGRADQARSGLLPQITASATYQRVHGSLGARAGTTTGAGAAPATGAAPVAGATTVASTGTYDYFSAGASASQLIWDFGQTYERFRAANRLIDTSRANEQTTELQVVLNVRRAYFHARAQRALVVVGEQTLANQELHMKQIQGFVAVGTRPEIDLAQARTDVANSRVALINAQNGYAIAKAQLNQAMGIVAEDDFDVADEGLGPVEGEDRPSAQLAERALAVRPELLSLERTREGQELTVRSIRGGYGPVLSAAAGTSLTGTSIDSLGPSWNVGATLTWPLFQGGLTRAQVREAEANVASTRAALDAERMQIRFDVEQAVLTVRAAKASIDAAGDALANARERLRLAEGRYAQGVGSVIELGDAQVALTNAAAQRVQADFNLGAARAQLLAALGRP
jgi:outer membrane protein